MGELAPADGMSPWTEKALKVGWLRPFRALASMAPHHRELMRSKLRFKWDRATQNALGAERAEREAWEIINTHNRGVISRLHVTRKQLFSWKSWRWEDVLTRLLDQYAHPYLATATERELEALLLECAYRGRKSRRKPGAAHVPSSPAKAAKKLGLLLDVMKDLEKMKDGVIDNSDEPAVAAVLAICAHGVERGD